MASYNQKLHRLKMESVSEFKPVTELEIVSSICN